MTRDQHQRASSTKAKQKRLAAAWPCTALAQ